MTSPTSPPPPLQNTPLPNPKYFDIIPVDQWDPAHYIEFSAQRRQASKHGLQYLDRSRPPSKNQKFHGINTYRWGMALRSFEEEEGTRRCEKAKALLRDGGKERIRRLFRAWFAENFSPRNSRGSRSTGRATIVTGDITFNQSVVGGTLSNNLAHSTNCGNEPRNASNVEGHLVQRLAHESDEDFQSILEDTPSPRTPSPESTSAQQTFWAVYRDIPEKWKLKSTERVVEDIIHDACMATDSNFMSKSSLLPSFVIDLGDEDVKRLFLPPELDEINAAMPGLPPPDDVLLGYLGEFASVRSVEELRATLHKNHYIPEGGTFDNARDGNKFYAYLALNTMLNIYASPNRPLTSDHCEDWFTSSVWASIIDNYIMSIPGITLDRKETHLRATGIRKNRSRTRTGKGNYRKSGRHYDGIIHSIGEGCVEYVVLEASASEKGGETSTKYLDDWLKIGRGLRDMMNVLHLQANHNPKFLPHLQAIGIMNSASTFQYSRMVSPVGNICLLKREDVLTIPAGLNGGLGQLLHIITSMVKLRRTVDMTRSWIVSAVEGGLTPEELDRELREGFKSYPARLSWADEAD